MFGATCTAGSSHLECPLKRESQVSDAAHGSFLRWREFYLLGHVHVIALLPFIAAFAALQVRDELLEHCRISQQLLHHFGVALPYLCQELGKHGGILESLSEALVLLTAHIVVAVTIVLVIALSKRVGNGSRRRVSGRWLHGSRGSCCE